MSNIQDFFMFITPKQKKKTNFIGPKKILKIQLSHFPNETMNCFCR